MKRRLFILLLLLPLLAGCTHLFFQPNRQLVLKPENFGLAYEPVDFRSADGTALFGWFLRASGPAAARGTIVFLHGNAENISTHIASIAWLPAQGFNVFIFDYRGYGASGGSPSLPGAQQDIDATLRTVLARNDIDRQRLIVYGQSLGGALAVYNVAHSPYREHIRALVVEAAFSSYTGIAREKMAANWLTWPLQWLPSMTVDNDYSPLAAIRQVSPIPLLLIHGDQDVIVPPHHGQLLFATASEPKQLWVVPGAGHLQPMREEAWRERLTAYLREMSK